MDEKEKAREYVLKTVKDKDVKLIGLWFTDILGFLKSFAIAPGELEEVLASGACRQNVLRHFKTRWATL